MFIKLVTEVSVALQFLSFLFIQQEAVDVGEELIRRHWGDEALSVQPEIVQQHHAEVGSGDSECLSTERHKSALGLLKEYFIISYVDIIKASITNIVQL